MGNPAQSSPLLEAQDNSAPRTAYWGWGDVGIVVMGLILFAIIAATEPLTGVEYFLALLGSVGGAQLFNLCRISAYEDNDKWIPLTKVLAGGAVASACSIVMTVVPFSPKDPSGPEAAAGMGMSSADAGNAMAAFFVENAAVLGWVGFGALLLAGIAATIYFNRPGAAERELLKLMHANNPIEMQPVLDYSSTSTPSNRSSMDSNGSHVSGSSLTAPSFVGPQGNDDNNLTSTSTNTLTAPGQ